MWNMLETKQQATMDALVEPVLVSVREEERLLQRFSHNLPFWGGNTCVLKKHLM